MKCHRCDGLMVDILIIDYLDVATAHKCINCGEVFDDITVDNRIKQYAEEYRKLIKA